MILTVGDVRRLNEAIDRCGGLDRWFQRLPVMLTKEQIERLSGKVPEKKKNGKK